MARHYFVESFLVVCLSMTSYFSSGAVISTASDADKFEPWPPLFHVERDNEPELFLADHAVDDLAYQVCIVASTVGIYIYTVLYCVWFQQ